MGRTAGRTPDQTRRLILDAAATVVRHRGVGATLDEIADAAGVSKGGLVYHFASKDALLQALTASLLEDFRTAVREALDPADSEPGRLTRAYIRACFDSSPDDRTDRDNLLLIAQLISDDRVAALAADDTRRWSEELAADDLPGAVVELIVAAADGASAARLWGDGADPAARARLRDRLLMLTRERRLWAVLADQG